MKAELQERICQTYTIITGARGHIMTGFEDTPVFCGQRLRAGLLLIVGSGDQSSLVHIPARRVAEALDGSAAIMVDPEALDVEKKVFIGAGRDFWEIEFRRWQVCRKIQKRTRDWNLADFPTEITIVGVKGNEELYGLLKHAPSRVEEAA